MIIKFRAEPLPPPEVLEPLWRGLEAVARPSFFTSWHWIGTLLTAIPAASRPRLLRGSLDRETVALGLLGERVARRRYGLICSRSLYLNEIGDPIFDAPMIEHNGLLAVTAHEHTARKALIDWFANHRSEADELNISGSRDRLCETLVEGRGLGRNGTAVPSYSVDLSHLSASQGELFPVLSANARQQLRRAFRHFERFGPLRVERAATLSEAFEFFAELKRLHVASWERRGKPHSFSAPFFEPFHRLLIERSFAAGGTQLLRASAGDQVIGYLYNFRHDGHVYAYQSGFAYDDDANARPGAVTHALAIRDAYRSGAAVYDFLAGRNRLKESFATRCEPMMWEIIQQPRLVFRLEHLARGIKHAVEQTAGKINRHGKILLTAWRGDRGNDRSRGFGGATRHSPS